MVQREIFQQYQRQRARGASPVGIIVLLYDAAIESLRRAKRAAESGRIEERVAASNHVLLIINELTRSLDYARGGEVARHLEKFYGVARAKLMDANFRSDPGAFEEALGMFCTLREAWRQVELETAVSGKEGPAAAAPAADEPAGLGWSA